MKTLAQVLSASVARAFAVMCAGVIVATAHTAQAGINVWTSHGPPGGDVRALAIDPSTPDTLYAGTDGGVFKSTDAGATWRAANAGLPGGVFVYALAIDPLTPSTLYAGTGGGVFKSTDAGATWGAANAGLVPGGVFVYALAIDPITPSTLYAAISDSAKAAAFSRARTRARPGATRVCHGAPWPSIPSHQARSTRGRTAASSRARTRA